MLQAYIEMYANNFSIKLKKKTLNDTDMAKILSHATPILARIWSN